VIFLILRVLLGASRSIYEKICWMWNLKNIIIGEKAGNCLPTCQK